MRTRAHSGGRALLNRFTGRNHPVCARMLAILALTSQPNIASARQLDAHARFTEAPWKVVAPRILPGILANRVECLIFGVGGDTLRVPVWSRETPVRIPDRLAAELKKGTAHYAIHLAGSTSSQCLVELSAPLRLEPGATPVLGIPLSGSELGQFLDRQILREFRAEARGQSLPGLSGPGSVADLGGGTYRLSVTLGQVVQLASPDTCRILMFDQETAYRICVPTGLFAGAPSTGVVPAPAMPINGLGTAPTILLATPWLVQLGQIGINAPQEVRVSLTSWSPRSVELHPRFQAGGLSALDVPPTLRLEAGKTVDLAFQVRANRRGSISGKLTTGRAGANIDVTGQVTDAVSGRGGEGGGGGGGEHPPKLSFAATYLPPASMRLTWISPGEGVTYELSCQSVSSPEVRTAPFDFKGHTSKPAGMKETAEFRNLLVDGDYRFTLRLTGNGISRTESLTRRLAP